MASILQSPYGSGMNAVQFWNHLRPYITIHTPTTSIRQIGIANITPGQQVNWEYRSDAATLTLSTRTGGQNFVHLRLASHGETTRIIAAGGSKLEALDLSGHSVWSVAQYGVPVIDSAGDILLVTRYSNGFRFTKITFEGQVLCGPVTLPGNMPALGSAYFNGRLTISKGADSYQLPYANFWEVDPADGSIVARHWVEPMGGGWVPEEIIASSDGYLYAAGLLMFSGVARPAVTKLDSGFNVVWTTPVGNNYGYVDGQVTSFAFDDSGNLYFLLPWEHKMVSVAPDSTLRFSVGFGANAFSSTAPHRISISSTDQIAAVGTFARTGRSDNFSPAVSDLDGTVSWYSRNLGSVDVLWLPDGSICTAGIPNSYSAWHTDQHQENQ